MVASRDRRERLVVRAVAWLSLVGTWLLAGGCFEVAGYDDFTFQKPFRGQLEDSRIDKIDLLFVIDNSRRTADKHAILIETLEPFVRRLFNPLCVPVLGGPPKEMQPSSPNEPCLGADERREFLPVRDMHIGVITTSLGGRGGDLCEGMPSVNDRAHLIDRVAVGSAERVPTFEGLGFLSLTPEDSDVDDLVINLQRIVAGVGELGCGFESPLEAWYRFLVDPEPYESIAIGEDNMARREGIDELLLAQRAAFVRPDSLLSIVMVTDENDCSIIDGGSGYLTAQTERLDGSESYTLPPGRAICEDSPNDPCCRSCGMSPGPGCDASNDCLDPPDPSDDPLNLRCFDQKRRFGLDLLHPVDRYRTGLTSAMVPNQMGELVDNPLLAGRPEGRVVLAGIVGVPWQDIARTRDDGTPDLKAGLDLGDNAVGGVKNASELLKPREPFNNTWEIILGDPAGGTLPADAFMIESIAPRTGTNPVTGTPLTPPGESPPNEINRGEYRPTEDLQYACVFGGKSCVGGDANCKAGLNQPCTPDGDDCRTGLVCVDDDGDARCAQDCSPASNDCTCGEDDPRCRNGSGEITNFKYVEAAYPGTRLLSVLRLAENLGVVGSICPAQLDVATEEDFGFTPALNSAIVERLEVSLQEHLCLDRSLLPDDTGRVDCILFEKQDTTEDCACSGGRRTVQTDEEFAAKETLFGDEKLCLCIIPQAESEQNLQACRNELSEPVTNEVLTPVHAWCFVDAMSSPRVGAPELTAGCPSERRRRIRLTGDAKQAEGTELFLHCN